tara:strand:- start:62 stop:1462 length:1401 start_codon:yes stop_codon:yes gene_type:complete
MRFFSTRKKETKVNLKIKFPWIEFLENRILEQKQEPISQRLKHFIDLQSFVKTNEWKNLTNQFKARLIDTGYPEYAADLEFELLFELFSAPTINSIFSNPSNSFNESMQAGTFEDEKIITKNFKITRSPKGLVLIVGSSNTILPIILAIIISYLCGNITIVQLSNLHKNIIPNFFDKLPYFKKNCIYFTNLNQADDDGRRLLIQLISEVKWEIINVWGGEDANDFYYTNSRNNKNRPKILNMEPLTGIVLIQSEYLQKKQAKLAEDLARAISTMGQQLCSSPTEGYIIGTIPEPLRKEFFLKLIDKLEETYTDTGLSEAKNIKLDRVLNNAIDSGAKVYTSNRYGNHISIINSNDHSVFFNTTPKLNLSIHNRNNFLELININSFENAYSNISRINCKATHDQIKKVQTVLVFGNENFWKDATHLAKMIGAYRVIDLKYVLKRHPLEALDGMHLVEEFSYPISILN